ncbi:BLUF domain-containing protein [Flavobacterium sp.]|uniref:BLUF domain-containing protein n=1 Tax=Flavobacterium sp. TaxID=239 RepID=UPI00374DCD2A
MSLHRIIYLSTAADNLSIDELKQLWIKAKSNNEKINVTGILLYIDGDFLQIFEGEKEIVQNLFELIKIDKRHKSIITVYNNTIDKLVFPDWSMAFSSTDYKEIQKLQGFENITRKNMSKIDDKTAIIFINTFVESHRNEVVYT